MIARVPDTYLPPLGFTLVETLVVLTIIGVLAALILSGVFGVINKAKEARIVTEIKLIEQELNRYRRERDSYPPDFSTATVDDWRDTARDHVKQAFPRYSGNPFASSPRARREYGTLDPAEAIVFWLGGYSRPWIERVSGQAVPRADKVLGIRADATRPFIDRFPTDVDLADGWTKPSSFQFAESRLQDNDGDGWYEYYPPGSKLPYVYFEAHTYSKRSGQGGSLLVNDPGYVKPYTLDARSGSILPYVARLNAQSGRFTIEEMVNPTGFQLIAAGLDDDFGAFLDSQGNPSRDPVPNKVYPSGENYSRADEDNIASFSEGKTLGDASP